MLYSGVDEGDWWNIFDSSGHAFVCDGYKSDGTFHFNWGWDGDYNDWFPLTALEPGS